MADEGKKISFGFSKIKKQSNLIKPVEVATPVVEYVDSFDGAKGKFSYKGNVRCDEPVKKELVIPLIGTKTVLEVIRAKLDENNAKNAKESDKDEKNEAKVDSSKGGIGPSPNGGNDASEDAQRALSIDDLAAREILNDMKNNVSTTAKEIVIKQTPKAVEEKDIPIDYENIPVSDFGLAMLRGMGWTPQTGIGKEQRVVPVTAPKLRPKGLGLGADKVLIQKSNQDPDLTMGIKSYVRFLSGAHKGSYGQVEAMDDDSGRIVVKLALGGTVSASEMIAVPVTRKEYEKNCKVINSSKYDRYVEPRESEEAKPKGRSPTPERKKAVVLNNSHRKEKYDRKDAQEVRRRRPEKRSSSRERREKGDSVSESSGSERDRRKAKKHKREESRERRRKKKRKKEKKRSKYSSDSDTDDSSSRSRSHKWKHKHR